MPNYWIQFKSNNICFSSNMRLFSVFGFFSFMFICTPTCIQFQKKNEKKSKLFPLFLIRRSCVIHTLDFLYDFFHYLLQWLVFLFISLDEVNRKLHDSNKQKQTEREKKIQSRTKSWYLFIKCKMLSSDIKSL